MRRYLHSMNKVALRFANCMLFMLAALGSSCASDTSSGNAVRDNPLLDCRDFPGAVGLVAGFVGSGKWQEISIGQSTAQFDRLSIREQRAMMLRNEHLRKNLENQIAQTLAPGSAVVPKMGRLAYPAQQSPDGHSLAAKILPASSGVAARISNSFVIRNFDDQTDKIVRTPGMNIESLEWRPDSRLVAVAWTNQTRLSMSPSAILAGIAGGSHYLHRAELALFDSAGVVQCQSVLAHGERETVIVLSWQP